MRSLEQLVEEEADKRRPNLEYQSLPPSRWLHKHVMRWLEDTFSWSGEYAHALGEKEVSGEQLVTSDDKDLLNTYSITAEDHRAELQKALKDQNLWG